MGKHNWLLISALFLAACGDQRDYETRFHTDGKAKPRVAIVNLIDHSDARMPWSLSDEITQEVSTKLSESGRIFIRSLNDLPIPLPLTNGKLNPFKDHSWLKGEQTDTEFYVFLELVEHAMEPRQIESNNPSYDLIMSVRVKVVDVRSETPKIVLQEFIEQSNYIPSQLASLDYHSFGYGKATFALSPIGLAHSKLIKRIASRIQDYVLIAKSRS